MVNFEDFMKLDIRVGEIIRVESFEKAKKSLLISYWWILVRKLV